MDYYCKHQNGNNISAFLHTLIIKAILYDWLYEEKYLLRLYPEREDVQNFRHVCF